MTREQQQASGTLELASDAKGRVAHESLHDVVCRAHEAERMTVYRYLASLGLEPEIAQDLSQEVFLKLYVALRRGEEIHMLRAWLFKVASHLFLNLRRAT